MYDSYADPVDISDINPFRCYRFKHLKKESEQDLSTMSTFKGKAGQKVSITGSVGDHILSGFIAIKEKGVKK